MGAIQSMRVEKGAEGYIGKRKKVDAICLLFYIVLGIIIFLSGYFITKTRANIFTVLAVLMVLPGAKRMVALCVMLPRKSVSHERCEKIRAIADGGTLYVDYVFTSTEKIMHLDFLLVKNGNVLGVLASSKQDEDYIKKYLTGGVHKISSHYHVSLFSEDDEFVRQIRHLSQKEADKDKEKEVLEYLYSLIV